MSTYVLIHGSWHGSWCWEKVVPLLEQAGHEAMALDLPAHGDDETPVPEVSLRSYADRVCQVLDSRSEPVILVGHSMGGIAISQAAESCPEKIETLVYLCAFLLRDGESLFQLAQEDTESLILPNFIVDEEQGISTIRDEAVTGIFYGDCSAEDAARAKLLLCPDPLAPVGTPISVTQENFGKVPRVYIECLRDRAIGPAAQKRMYEASPCDRVVSMDVSHSPFLSRPEELVSHLTSL